MQANTDQDTLIQHLTRFFSSMAIPGLHGQIRELSHAHGTATLNFHVETALANPYGFVQGGIIAAMLDACIAIAGAAKSGGLQAMPLVEMKMSFVRPVTPGVIIGFGETLRLGKQFAFIEATLRTTDGTILARASGTAVPTALPSTH